MSQYASTAEEIVNEALDNLGGRKKSTSNGVMICCPFHADKTPSFGINLSTSNGIPLGYGHCLGCGKNAQWNEIADQLGLPKLKRGDLKITSYKQRERQHLLMKRPSLSSIVTKDFRCSDYFTKWDADKEWRTIPGSVMHQFAYSAFDVETARSFAILPVTIDGELHGAIKAVLKKSKNPNDLSYITSKASNKNSWVKRYGLFPYDVTTELLRATGLRTIVLVEGPRDALHLIANGIPALAILGSQAWSATKMKILLGMPIERVVLCMDGDKAGKSATRMIAPMLERHVDLLDFDLYGLAKKRELDKIDPAMLRGRYLQKLRATLI